MGLEHSKNSYTSSDINSDNKNKLKNTVKLVTYNIKTNSYSENKFDNILMYLTYEKKNIIYCIQGLYDNTFRIKLSESLKDYSKYFPDNYIIPSISNNNDNINKIGLFYISTYPILNYDIYTFTKNNNILLNSLDKNSKGILTINTLINNHIVSLYHVALQHDIPSIMNCNTIRSKQIKELFNIINNNITSINNTTLINNNNYKQSNIHIIIGSIYDPLIDNKVIDSIDINPLINNETIHNKKHCEYIYIYLHNYNETIKEDIITYIKKLNIEIIDAKINSNVTYTENYPFEIIFKLVKKIDI
jgi:hypothetical protein